MASDPSRSREHRRFGRRGRWASSPRTLRRRVRSQAGNTLVLFPTAVLIVFGLGAVAIDSATIFLGQRRLADLAAAVANDAVAGIDLEAFYTSDGAVVLDATRGASRTAQLRSSQAQDRGFEDVVCTLAVADGQATATCAGQVRPILATFWPTDERRQLTASETAVGQQS